MQTSMTNLHELRNLIDFQEQIKRDYIIPDEELSMVDDQRIAFNDNVLKLNDVAHRQIAKRYGIPKKYYDRMTAIPGLRQLNVNEWLWHSEKSAMVRTHSDTTRAILSDRYKPLDNILVFKSLMHALSDVEQKIKISGAEITDERMYIQVTFPDKNFEVQSDDPIEPGFTIVNSEVGMGAVDVQTFIRRLVCSNGLISNSLLRQYHIGRKIGGNEDDYTIFQDDTIMAEMQSFSLRLRDVLRHAVSEANIEAMQIKLQKMLGIEIPQPQKAIKEVTKRYSFTEWEEELMQKNWLEEREPNAWGLLNSVTSMSHQIDDVDRQYEIERAAGDLIELKPSEWEKIAA